MSKEQTRKNGRPSKNEQLQIQRELLPYFEQGITPGVTAEKTGINIKTVYDYFDDLVEKASKLEESDFLQRQRNERIRIIISFDKQILEANKHFDDINDEINRLKKEQKTIPQHLFSLRLDAMKYRSYLTEKKGIFLMQPTMEEALEKKVSEMIKKHGNPGDSN